MKKSKSEKLNLNKFGLIILSILIFSWIFTRIVNWNYQNWIYANYDTYFFSILCWFYFYIYSQKIVDKNLFKRLTPITFIIVISTIIKQYFTKIEYNSLFISFLPLIFLSSFRLVIYLFYPKYPCENKTISIIFTTGIFTEWKGKNKDYKPNWNERFISIIILFLPILILFVGLKLIKDYS